MKKHLLVLGMIICMLGLTACGSSKADDTSYLSDPKMHYPVQSTILTDSAR